MFYSLIQGNPIDMEFFVYTGDAHIDMELFYRLHLLLYRISESHSGGYEEFYLLEYNAM
jgi:hypothetical protein